MQNYKCQKVWLTQNPEVFWLIEFFTQKTKTIEKGDCLLMMKTFWYLIYQE